MALPFSQACENNKEPILAVLKAELDRCTRVLEIGSGTGQHAVYFAPALPYLVWQCSDQAHNHAGINAWIDAFPASNLRRPLVFTVGQDAWPQGQFDGVFSANTAHIMQPHETRLMMATVADNLPQGGVFCQYGPFTLDGAFTSASNRDFDAALRRQGYGGLRDIEELKNWSQGKLRLSARVSMPANNFTLVWHRV